MVIALTFAAALAVATFVPSLQPGDTVPPLPLVDQRGAAFSLAQLRGNAVILSFIYTRCADPLMCPLVSSKFARLERAIGTSRVRLLEITLDPGYDSPRVLNAYGRAFHADPQRWILATGAAGSIADLAARLNVATQWTAPGTLVHTESVIVLDRDGRLAQTIDGNSWSPDDVLAVANALVDPHPSLLARARLWVGAVAEACGGGRVDVPVLAVLGGLIAAIAAAAFALFRGMRPA